MLAVRKAEKLAHIDFATATPGYYGLFKYNAAHISEFVTPKLSEQVNAYFVADTPRNVAGQGREWYQIVELVLLHVEPDLDYPVELLDRKQTIIIAREDGAEDVKIFDPDSEGI